MGVGCFWIQPCEFVFCLIWEALFSSSATNCLCASRRRRRSSSVMELLVRLHCAYWHLVVLVFNCTLWHSMQPTTAAGWFWWRGRKSRRHQHRFMKIYLYLDAKTHNLKRYCSRGEKYWVAGWLYVWLFWLFRHPRVVFLIIRRGPG